MRTEKQVKLSNIVNDLLDAISEKRKNEESFIKTKQSIVAEAVIALHKKEFK